MIRLWSPLRLALAVMLPCALASAMLAEDVSPRVVRSIDRDWTFQYFPQGEPDLHWAKPESDDSRWPAIALPHTWSTYETTREMHPFIAHATEREDSYWWYGWGWYRKHLKLARTLESKEVFLEFDGVQKYALVYVNGHLAGEHKGGYTSFSIDVTKWVHFGADNVIAVQVSARRDDDFGHIPPMTAGNFDVYGGVYRSVRLVLTDKVHVPFQGSADAEGGTFITTPKVSHDDATVRAVTWVRNDREIAATIIVRSTIADASGTPLTSEDASLSLQPGEVKSAQQMFTSIGKPHLWSTTTPYVYTMKTTLLLDGHIIDTFASSFGVRWFSWNAKERRLYLNGEPVRLIGTNRHQEFPWLGDAMPVWMQIDDLRDMRYNLGYNFQRTAHYPQAPEVYDFCDHNGMIVLEESPNIKDIDFGRAVQEQTMREMVRRDRNHPSILFWGIGNETDHPADSAWTWQEDQTRIINLRRGTNGGAHVMTTDEDLGLEQTLRCTVRGWYNDDAHNFAPGTGEPASGQVTGTEEWQHTTDAQYLQKKAGDNVVVFLYADHGADRIYKNAPLKYVNPKGWVDGLRFPKYVYYLWQANFTPKLMVFVHPWAWQQRYVGQRKDITIDSNGDSVELFLDGRSLGSRKPDAANVRVVTFPNVEVARGTLQAVARRNNETATDTLQIAGDPVRLELRTRHEHLVADRSGLAVVEVRALDAKGVEVPYVHPELTWKISGEGRLVGPAQMSTDTDKNDAAAGSMYIVLPTANLIRTTATAGEIHVWVSAPGLAAGAITLRSVASIEESGGVEEVPLSDAGRVAVARDSSVRDARRTGPPRVFEHISQDYRLKAADLAQARTSIEEFLHEHNPKLSHDGRALDDAVEKLAHLLLDNHGNLIADWYNFTSDQYEDVATIAGAVDETQAPQEVREALSRDYADRVLLHGEAVDATAEASAVKAALSSAAFVTRAVTVPAGAKHTDASSVGQLLAEAYPRWSTLSVAQRQDVLRNVVRYNPSLREQNADLSSALPAGVITLPKESIALR